MKKSIIERCFHKGNLRKTKPFKKIANDDPDRMFKGCVNYCWRMLCFDYFAYPPHCCMPVTADWDIPLGYQDRKEKVKELDALIKEYEATRPITDQKGALRWGRALCMI